jgi:hypothetical protein
MKVKFQLLPHNTYTLTIQEMNITCFEARITQMPKTLSLCELYLMESSSHMLTSHVTKTIHKKHVYLFL